MATWVAPVLQSNRVAQARRAGLRLPSQDVGLGRLLELHVGEPGVRTEPLAGPQDLAGRRDLGLAQRVERDAAILGEPGRFRAGHDAVR